MHVLGDISMLLRALLFITSALAHLCAGAEWSYDDHHGETGPSYWKKIAPDCGGSSQSPIDINLGTAIYNSEMPGIQFVGYHEIPSNVTYTLLNNGHTVQLSVAGGQMSIKDGALPGAYQLLQFHVHWGGVDAVGSEHRINGKWYPLEIHFVHFSKRYNNIGEALRDSQGLAVVGVFAEIGEKHPALDDIITRFGLVKYKGTNTSDIKPFRMGDLLPPRTSEFIRYNGSLTTPSCQESVVWTVLKNPIKISKTQLNAFRSLSHGSGAEPEDVTLENNYRPVQRIGQRTVLRTFAVETTPAPQPPVKPPKMSGSGTIHSSGQLFTFACCVVIALVRARVFSSGL